MKFALVAAMIGTLAAVDCPAKVTITAYDDNKCETANPAES